MTSTVPTAGAPSRRPAAVLALVAGGALALGAAPAFADPAPAPYPTLAATLTASQDGGTTTAMTADGKTVVLALPAKTRGVVTSVRLLTWQQAADGSWSSSVQALPGATVAGQGLSLSGDGSTLALGTYDVKHHRDTVAVFSKAAGAWARTADLTIPAPTGGANSFALGRSTTLSADGSTLVAVAPVEHGPFQGRGHVVVFQHAARGWSIAADLASPKRFTLRPGYFGRAAAVSEDGSTVAVRWEQDRGRTTSSQVVLFSAASGWKEAGTVDLGPWVSVGALSLSGNGTVVASAGGLQVGKRVVHATYVFARTGTGWARTGTFTPLRTTAKLAFAGSVALSASGDTVVVAAPRFYGTTAAQQLPFGAGYRYVWANGRWNWGGLMQLPKGSSPQRLGASLSLSSDGSRAVLAGSTNLRATDRAYLYATP